MARKRRDLLRDHGVRKAGWGELRGSEIQDRKTNDEGVGGSMIADLVVMKFSDSQPALRDENLAGSAYLDSHS